MSEKADNSGQAHPAKRHIDEALRLVSGPRCEKYGPPEKNFQRIAWLWQAYLRSVLDAAGGQTLELGAIEVCHMLDLVKLARLIESPDHEDSITDRFGYQACYVDLIAGERPNEVTAEEWHDWPPPTEKDPICGGKDDAVELAPRGPSETEPPIDDASVELFEAPKRFVVR